MFIYAVRSTYYIACLYFRSFFVNFILVLSILSKMKIETKR